MTEQLEKFKHGSRGFKISGDHAARRLSVH